MEITRLKQLIAAAAAAAIVAGCGGRQVFTPQEWVEIEAGAFRMGAPQSENCREPGDFIESPHQVTLTTGFEMTVSETTQGQFEDKMGYNPSTTEYLACGTDCPVDKVSWHEAAAFCNQLSKDAGKTLCYTCTGKGSDVRCDNAVDYVGQEIYRCPGYRLPTEAEWEYACRAGTKTALYTGDLQVCDSQDTAADQAAWYLYNSGNSVKQARKKKANAWGLYDMPGNVWEWVHDLYGKDLGTTPVTNPIGATTSSLDRHILRGGSVEVEPKLLRCAARWNANMASQRLKLHGFRCVRSKLAGK